MSTSSVWEARALRARRAAVIGPYSPMFYDEPLHVVSGHDVWLTGSDGVEYLDAYNNVPHVGHCNPEVVRAISEQAAKLNVHTRYLHEPVVEYAEMLLATFAPYLDKVFLTNSGSEANELALRIARQHTGATGVLVTDFSYHGNTTALAELTTGLPVKEPLGQHVRALRIPDVVADSRPEHVVLAEALEAAAAAIASLRAAGHGVSALLFDPLFSTEGLLQPPAGYVEGLVALVHGAGGLVIADEVQSGLGRSGSHFWGHEVHGIRPDLVTMGKPLGNGHPLGGVVTTTALLEEFGSANLYFNTFAGNPVSAAAGMAVLRETASRELQSRAAELGRHAREVLDKLAAERPSVRAVRGSGLFFGLEFVDDDGGAGAARAKWVVEDMLRRGVLISKIGPRENVLKIRPPMVFEHEHLDLLVDRLTASLDELEQVEARGGLRSGSAAPDVAGASAGTPDIGVSTGLFIDGRWRSGSRTFDVLNPADGSLLTRVTAADESDVDDAVRSARRAFDGEWGQAAGTARAAVLHRIADLIERDADRLARLEALDIGKPVGQPAMLDVPNAAATFRHFAGWADKITGSAIPTDGYFGRPTHSYTVREPIGVVAAIIPWNTPLMIAAWKLAPALATGNTVVVKPAEDAPLSILALAELVQEAGVPAGVVNVIPGLGEEAGAALVRHPEVDKISFTGSPEVGRQIGRVAAESFKRVTLELGGKSPQIVLADADVEAAVQGIALGLFFNQGEVCAAGTRVLVHRSLYDQVVEALAGAANGQVVGDPFDPQTTMGALVSQEHLDRVLSYVDRAKDEGARLVAGGGRPRGEGYFIQPTVFADVARDATIAREEIFGPVGAVIPFDDVEEAIEIANETEYGLAATIWTRDVSLAHTLAHEVRAGAVWVNGWAAINPALPWGGVKTSGVGRELGWSGILANTEEKVVTIVL
ncbi:acyl-CoA reductase-like NAD-dependent aldehyde dehydrogenase [Geodermatophilus tzadiensis]|uniref:Acyl-CoA reductase-like NAD-dependent aldehyde dehydrogenase n=1 Tax=Geodermatophilus tzadiensis TaxID=1137988 RepID=A0A2T0TV98_9ACTN|nr:aldehyde dehydrogenase family protein [Geodermatophilus tzadiensis]PRY49587.1 acyl-CoA reductase-like NAD-dependent aldehyde dehydrogenase [Geodermatophilus tzadiensis]